MHAYNQRSDRSIIFLLYFPVLLFFFFFSFFFFISLSLSLLLTPLFYVFFPFPLSLRLPRVPALFILALITCFLLLLPSLCLCVK
jgi:hypothetical protein